MSGYTKGFNETKYVSLLIKDDDDGIPKEGSHCICLMTILIDSVFKIGKNYCSQMYLEECKYIVKE